MATKENLFEGAKFGDRYQCRNGMQAVFVNNCYGEVTLLINDDDTKEDWLCNYDLDGRADCDEEYDIVKRIGPLDGRTHNQKQPAAMKYQFHLTCPACPEQYDVMDGHHVVAYVRYRHGCLTVNPVLPKRETRRRTTDDRERTEQVYDYGTDIISETLGDMWDGRLPDDQRQAILQRIDRAVSHYWQHPFRRGHDGDDHHIDHKTGDYTDGWHE